MTLKQLRERVSIGVCLQGTFSVTITVRGKEYYTSSSNTLAYDAIVSGDRSYYSTERQAYEALYKQCKINNNIY